LAEESITSESGRSFALAFLAISEHSLQCFSSPGSNLIISIGSRSATKVLLDVAQFARLSLIDYQPTKKVGKLICMIWLRLGLCAFVLQSICIDGKSTCNQRRMVAH